MHGSTPLLCRWSWATLCDFFPNLQVVAYFDIMLHLRRDARHTSVDYGALDHMTTIDQRAEIVPEHIFDHSKGGGTVMRSLQTHGVTPPTSVVDGEKLQLPTMFCLPLEQLRVSAPEEVAEQWCTVLKYRRMAGASIERVSWGFGINHHQFALFASVSPPGLKHLEAEIWSDWPLTVTLDRVMSGVDSRHFPDLMSLSLVVLFQSGVGTDELLEQSPSPFYWADNNLPEDLDVAVLLCILPSADNEGYDLNYYAERLLESLPLLWIKKLTLKLGNSQRIAVSTACELKGFKVSLSTDAITYRVNEALHGPAAGSTGGPDSSSGTGSNSALSDSEASDQDLSAQIAGLGV